MENEEELEKMVLSTIPMMTFDGNGMITWRTDETEDLKAKIAKLEEFIKEHGDWNLYQLLNKDV